jgi:hypothetical protein
MIYLKRLSLIFLSVFAVNGFVLELVPVVAQNQQSLPESAENNSRKITKEAVQALVDGIKKAGEQRNVDEIVRYFAPFIYSQFTVKEGSVSQTFELNGREEHRLYLESRLKNVRESETVDEQVQIRLSPDEEMAFVHRTRTVSVTANDGQQMLVTSEAEVRLAMVEGKLQILSIEEIADVDPLASPKP